MALVTGLLTEGKPLVEIVLADATPLPGAVAPQASAIPFTVRPYRALLDTGADITCLCDHVVAECRLRPIGFQRMIGALGPSLHGTYIVRIGILCGDQDLSADEGRSLFNLSHWRLPSFEIIIGSM